ncbi:MAG: ABC transporter permease, partial [Desulfovibrio sp.]
MALFSPRRFFAVTAKEFVQMRRDKLTFAMMIGIPLMQLILFGFAINNDPRHLPTVIVAADNSPFTRSIVQGLTASTYFDIISVEDSRVAATEALRKGDAQFSLTFPQGFSRDLIRGERPVILLEADATDPAATGNALAAFTTILDRALERDLEGPLAHLRRSPLPVQPRLHAQYNPESISQYNIVPGLMGVILTLTLVMITSLAMTRETERGTMENLLTTPARPLEVMLGKIVPYILVGYVQVSLILVASHYLFDVPFHGRIEHIYFLALIFIAANLMVGLTFSTMAKNQLQAVQLSVFFFLPSMLLSGFMFPFRGMPEWAQYVGSILPLTHFLRLVRGILLKGNGL